MIRRGRARSSVSRPSAWLIPGGGLVVYLALVMGLAATHSWPELPMPWWIAQIVPPIVYGGLVFVFVHGAAGPRLAMGTVALWAVHILVGMLTGALVGRIDGAAHGDTLGAFPPSPLPQLLWVPLLLFPLRGVIAGPQSRRAMSRARTRERGAVSDLRTPTPAPRPAAAVAPAAEPIVPAMPTAAPAVSRGPAEPRPRETSVRTSVFENGKPTVARGGLTPALPNLGGPRTVAEPPPQRVPDVPPAHEGPDEVVRVSFDRVAAQFPAGVFQLPTERMGAGLLEPGHLLIPQRLVVAQLAEGFVRVAWRVVSDQFPRHLLAMTDEEVVRQLPDGQVVLPLDELVPQLSSDIFAVALPTVDVAALECFPAPFQPAFPEEVAEVRSPTVEVPTLGAGTPAEPEPFTTAEVLLEAHEAGSPETTPEWVLEDDPGVGELETRSLASSEGPVLDDVDLEPVALEAVPTVASAQAAEAQAESPVIETAVPESPADMPAPPVVAEHATPAPVAPPAPPSRREPAAVRIEEIAGVEVTARRLATALSSYKALDVETLVVDGVVLFVAASPGSDITPVVSATRPLLALLAHRRAPWAIDQMTLRGPGAALVLTPLCAGRGGPVLASAVPASGPLAMLEVVSLRAASDHGLDAPTGIGDGATPHDDRQEPDLVDTEAPTRIRQIAATLGALGPVAAGALRDPEAERDLYVFLPAGMDTRVVGSFAAELDGAMKRASETGAIFHTAVLRCGKRRLIVRRENSDSERASIIVAGGETERPGLAYRQVESLALALDAR
jgi:hypothetical protein